MNEHEDTLDPGLDPAERQELEYFGEQLRHHRPYPTPELRSTIHRRIVAAGPREASVFALRRAAVACGASGLVLLGAVAAGVAGAGPLAA